MDKTQNSKQIYVSDRQLGTRYGVHRTAIWRWLRNGHFPEPVKLSPGCTRWLMDDVLEFEQTRQTA